jgi:hypothetical protein
LSVTDPDARAVVLHRNIVNVGYNVQAASDGKHKMLIAMDTGDVNDTHALAPMVEQVQENLGKTKMDVLADKGYHTGQQLEQCESLGVKTYVSPKASAANKRTGVFSVEEFHYSPKYDDYRCPAGKYLTTSGTVHYRKAKGKKATSVGVTQSEHWHCYCNPEKPANTGLYSKSCPHARQASAAVSFLRARPVFIGFPGFRYESQCTIWV